jgi:hypothetical protein
LTPPQITPKLRRGSKVRELRDDLGGYRLIEFDRKIPINGGDGLARKSRFGAHVMRHGDR